MNTPAAHPAPGLPPATAALILAAFGAAEPRRPAEVRMIQIPEAQAELDRLARDVADAALAVDREERDQTAALTRDEARWMVGRASDRFTAAVRRYEQAKRLAQLARA